MNGPSNRAPQQQEAAPPPEPGGLRTVAVTSGKGGVGKTSVVVNLAVACARLGARVTLLDADYGLGNVDIYLGLNSENTLEGLLRGRQDLGAVLRDGPEGVRILPASTGAQDLTCLTHEQQQRLSSGLRGLAASTDLLLVDTATGISDNVVAWLEAADEVLLVTSPDPAAIVDAYAVVKLLARMDAGKELSLLVNKVRNRHEAVAVHDGLRVAVREFLDRELDFFGHVLRDGLLEEAVRHRQPVVTYLPEAPASRCFRRLAGRLVASTAVRATPAEEADEALLEPVLR
jgi:flagellar biosynthesis protein FlhG